MEIENRFRICLNPVVMPQQTANDSYDDSFDPVVFGFEGVASPNNYSCRSDILNLSCITEQVLPKFFATPQCTDDSLTPYPLTR